MQHFKRAKRAEIFQGFMIVPTIYNYSLSETTEARGARRKFFGVHESTKN